MKVFQGKKFFILFFVLFAVGFSFYFYRRDQTKIKVPPKKGNIVESIYGLGTVIADKKFHVRTGLALTLRQMFVKEGDHVRAGQVLMLLDSVSMKTPIDGTVTEINFEPGETVPPQVSLMTVTQLNSLYLEVNLEQQSIMRIKKDQQVFISFESLRNERVEGKVTSVFPRDNQFIVRIDIDKWPPGVLPGMTADVAIQVGHREDVLLIPIKSIQNGLVNRIRNGKREKISVKLGIIDGQWAEVISDNIEASDELLTDK